MSYHLIPTRPISDEIKRIAYEQIDKSITELLDTDLGTHDRVHRFRKRCKKLRGLLRLIHPAMDETYQAENRWYRDQAAAFSAIRDAEVLLETSQALRRHANKDLACAHFDEIDSFLQDRKAMVIAEQAGELHEQLKSLTDELRCARERIQDWPLKQPFFSALLKGLRKTYSRGCRAMQEAFEDGSDEAWHDWRKRTKYHGFHVQLLRNLWRPVFQARRNELDKLGDLLGEDHDLAMFGQTLQESRESLSHSECVEVISCLCQKRRKRLQNKALPLGSLIYAEKPRHLCRRLKSYWKVADHHEKDSLE